MFIHWVFMSHLLTQTGRVYGLYYSQPPGVSSGEDGEQQGLFSSSFLQFLYDKLKNSSSYLKMKMTEWKEKLGPTIQNISVINRWAGWKMSKFEPDSKYFPSWLKYCHFSVVMLLKNGIILHFFETNYNFLLKCVWIKVMARNLKKVTICRPFSRLILSWSTSLDVSRAAQMLLSPATSTKRCSWAG